MILRRAAALWLTLALALAAVTAAPSRGAAADASLVVAARRVAEREYFRALDTAVTRAMLASVHDSHVRFLTPDQYTEFRDNLAGRSSYAGIGVRTTFPEGADGPFIAAVVPDSPAAAAGIKVVDQVLATDGVPFKGASSADVISRLRGPAGTSVMLGIRRRGATLEIPVTRAVIHTPAVEVEMIRPGVAYVRIWGFTRGVAVETRRALAALGQVGAIRAIVVDLRGNPGGLVIETEWVAGLFVPAGTALARTHSAGGMGQFVASGEPLFPGVPLALLTDRGSASDAEILTIGLRDANRVVVVGATTTGAFDGARDFALPEGGIMVTTRALTRPRDEAIEGIGIAPDRAVPITVDDMLRGEDVQLNAALALLGGARRAAGLAAAA